MLLTNVSLEHTEVLGDTEEQIAREKLAVAHAARTVVLPDDRFRALVPAGAEVRLGGAREAAAAFLGHEPPSVAAPTLAGRLERRGDEVRDGAHNPAGARWLADRLEPEGPYVVVASILRDKDADAMLAELARLGDTLVATASENPRALAADELAEAARPPLPHGRGGARPGRRARPRTRPRAAACSSPARSISSRTSPERSRQYHDEGR